MSVAENFECSFENFKPWGYPQILYICNVTKYPEVQHTKLESPSGGHQDGKNNLNVEGFNFENLSLKIDFFPHGLDEIFPNLKAIKIKSMGIKEIHQNDLKPFNELIVLNLYGNEIKNIEKDLFKFNPKLAAISFQENQISYIDMHVFDDLKSLNNLFIGNDCIKDTAKTPAKVALMILTIEKKCSNITQEMMLKKIERDLKSTKIEVEKSFREIKNELKSQDEKLNATKNEMKKIDEKLNENYQELKSEKIDEEILRENFTKLQEIFDLKNSKIKQEFLNFRQNLKLHENNLNFLNESYQKSEAKNSKLRQEILKLQNTSKNEEIKLADEISQLKGKLKSLKVSQHINETLANLKLELTTTKPQSDHITSDDSNMNNLITNKSFVTLIGIVLICFVTILNIILTFICFRKRNVRAKDKKEKM